MIFVVEMAALLALIVWWPRRTLLRFSHSHFPNRIFAFQIGFSWLISDFGVSYRILASHIGFSRLKSDLNITFPNRIFAPQIGLSYRISVSVCLYLKSMQGGGVPTNGCGSPPRCRVHVLADLKDKNQCYSYAGERARLVRSGYVFLNLIVS